MIKSTWFTAGVWCFFAIASATAASWGMPTLNAMSVACSIIANVWIVGGIVVSEIERANSKRDRLYFRHDLMTGRKWTERVWEREP